MPSVPRFSVIVPVYQVQAYLHECLESVLSQSFMDLELIAVDDCSPDACGAIVDEFAARDPRVRAVHLAESQGPDRARDAGLDLAVGDYLVLLDGGDTLTPDALWSIETRLKETGEPDVLVYGSAHTDGTGRAVRGGPTGPLKTCRRDFVEREDPTFLPAGCHGDTPWTYPVLPAAASIATLDRVCVRHRRRGQDAVPGTAGRRHFDVLERHDWVSSRPGRPARGCRAAFLRRARTYYRRHRTRGVRLPLRPRLPPGLVRLGLHQAFRALRTAMTLRRRTAKAVVKSLRALRAALRQARRRSRPCLPPRANRAVFPASTAPGCRRPAPDTPPAGRPRPARGLTGGHVRGSRSARLRAVFRERFCPYGDGRAPERAVRHMALGRGGEAAGPPPGVPRAGRHPVPWPAAAPVRSRRVTVPQPAGRQTVTDGH
ncbi:glycosyltransferase [Streptomyces sp. NPDC006393]|uniref:glycosyltransferase family 2 protein n=1 Tax=Streptomyces sp. NPDC006393 TaxID=3156763 RepID=UPI0033DA6A94